MKTLKILAAGALALFVSSSVFAQADSTTQQALDEIAVKSADVTSYTADVMTESNVMGFPRITKGTVSFKAPDKMHVKTTTNAAGGLAQEIFCSGGIVHTYLPAMKTATRMDMSALEAAGHDPLAAAQARDISKPFESFPAETIGYLGTDQTKDGAVHLFDAMPAREDTIVQGLSTPQMSVDTMLFRINAETGLPAEITMLAADGSVIMEQTWSNVRVNVAIADSEFEFNPPKGVRVEDMTDGALSAMNCTE
ncbi:MAG: hypothetical protein Kow0099_04120 [Candidatus Abyssubacteria bacterium]